MPVISVYEWIYPAWQAVGQVYRWKKEDLNDKNHSFPGAGHLQNPEEERIRKLERELRSLTEERDILKKVVAIFSKTPK